MRVAFVGLLMHKCILHQEGAREAAWTELFVLHFESQQAWTQTSYF